MFGARFGLHAIAFSIARYGRRSSADTRRLRFAGPILNHAPVTEAKREEGFDNMRKARAPSGDYFFRSREPLVSQPHRPSIMNPDSTNGAEDCVDLRAVIERMDAELRCLLGPRIQLATASLPAGGTAVVRAGQEELEHLLRHLALDTHDAMPIGGNVSIRTGRLGEVADCAAIVIHETPAAPTVAEQNDRMRIRKGRSLGLSASYDMIERAGGHFHVSCRGSETVLTICFPLAG
jgi:hypothetical protein